MPRAEQSRRLQQRGPFGRAVVADFLLDEDALFAGLTLSEDGLRLSHDLSARPAPVAPTPDLVSYLQAPVDVLRERTAGRASHHERGTDRDDLLRLTEAYARHFHRYEAPPLMIVYSENLDFADEAADCGLLLERLAALRGGREFFGRGP